MWFRCYPIKFKFTDCTTWLVLANDSSEMHLCQYVGLLSLQKEASYGTNQQRVNYWAVLSVHHSNEWRRPIIHISLAPQHWCACREVTLLWVIICHLCKLNRSVSHWVPMRLSRGLLLCSLKWKIRLNLPNQVHAKRKYKLSQGPSLFKVELQTIKKVLN